MESKIWELSLSIERAKYLLNHELNELYLSENPETEFCENIDMHKISTQDCIKVLDKSQKLLIEMLDIIHSNDDVLSGLDT